LKTSFEVCEHLIKQALSVWYIFSIKIETKEKDGESIKSYSSTVWLNIIMIIIFFVLTRWINDE